MWIFTTLIFVRVFTFDYIEERVSLSHWKGRVHEKERERDSEYTLRRGRVFHVFFLLNVVSNSTNSQLDMLCIYGKILGNILCI